MTSEFFTWDAMPQIIDEGGAVLRADTRRLVLEAATRRMLLEAAPRILRLTAAEDGMAYETAEKTAYESVRITLDLSPLLGHGETLAGITSVSATTPTGAAALTIAATTYSGNKAQWQASGGTAGTL